MARPKPLLVVLWQTHPQHISRLILEELVTYAKDKQVYPAQRALYRLMAYPQYNPATNKNDPPRYPALKVSYFDYWYGRLVEEGYIDIDQATRAVRCAYLMITEKDRPDN